MVRGSAETSGPDRGKKNSRSIGLSHLQSPDAAWKELTRGPTITSAYSEAYLELALQDWVLRSESPPIERRSGLTNLADAARKNHHDLWLADFLNGPFSSEAGRLLEGSITANRRGDTGRAARNAELAERLYAKAGNVAGAARSGAEAIYAYRRRSKARECLHAIKQLRQRILNRGYTYLTILADFENANCETMLGSFNQGWEMAKRTVAEAEQANYVSLHLRALTLLSSMDSSQGRFQEALRRDVAGLNLFWQGFYPPERGFQFYSDSALTSEQAGSWHLAALLQREALSMLSDTGRSDFKAAALFHLATCMLRMGNEAEARADFSEAYRLFASMNDATSAGFMKATSEIDLAGFEIESGNLTSARVHLQNAAPAIADSDNFVVKLSFYNASAELEHRLGHPDEESKYLQNTIAVTKQGFKNLGSIEDRWGWYQEVDKAYHMQIQLELERGRDPVQAFADWEEYRAAEAASVGLVPGVKRNATDLAALTKELRSATLISFIVFPRSVNVWVADDRGIRSFSVAGDSDTLKKEASAFLSLCADPNSPLEKVKQAGFRLYQRLFYPVQQEIDTRRSLVIEADSFLSGIPWPALVMPNGDFLEQRFTIMNTPGLVASHPSRPTPSRGRALVVYPGATNFEGRLYPPLPHAQEEAEFVAGYLPGAVYLQSSAVTATQVRSLLPHVSSFHFAGHAVGRKQGGELLLSNEDVLSASALRQLKLDRLELVVLSACSTADADVDVARSPNGLVQAFLAAGTRQVVASRWDTDSAATADFMKEFYGALGDKHDAASAITVASRNLLHEKATAHPYYWSAFGLFTSLN